MQKSPCLVGPLVMAKHADSSIALYAVYWFGLDILELTKKRILLPILEPESKSN